MVWCVTWTRCTLLLYFMMDALCILIAYMPSLILNSEPETYIYKRGVNCMDKDFQYDIIPSTIEDEIWVCINLLPAGLFGAGEVLTNWRHFGKSFYKVTITFLFGAFTNNSLTYLAKFSIGQLRPDFISECRLDCTGKEWVPDPDCYNVNARLSFYSFTSSHVMYYMVFTAFYLQARMTEGGWMQMLKPTMQLLLLLLAAWAGFTRIKDHKNHLYDVLIGLLQGGLLALIMVHYLFPEVFKLPEEVEESGEQHPQPTPTPTPQQGPAKAASS